jgi:hypothetical protein
LAAINVKLLSHNQGAIHGYANEAHWATRIRLQIDRRTRELALFNFAIDGRLRRCDRVELRVHDVVQGSHVAEKRSANAPTRGGTHAIGTMTPSAQ